jgi:hypothetical protein
MRLTANKFSKEGYKYQCDRCNKPMKMEERHLIRVIMTYDDNHQRWDLCPACYKALERGINKKRGGT